MSRLAIMSMSLAAVCSPAVAAEFVDSFLELHYAGSGGRTETLKLAVGLRAENVGTEHCADTFGDGWVLFESAARKQLADPSMTLDRVSCEAIGEHAKTITTRPVTDAGSSGER